MLFKDFRDLRIMRTVAATFVVATLLFSCKDELPVTDPIDAEKVPTHIILEMSLEQSSAARTKMRVYAPIMENFSKSTPPYEIFSKGINVKAFTSDGLLETEITAKKARHINSPDKEQWEAYGDVVINNYIKGETIETDTLYWDKSNKKIYTHCFVKLKSPSIFMQGYGMESDELARNAIILRPFDSYGIIKRDSTEVIYVDTVNFIGPILKIK
jgi:LPS export ABC transporter protein LptC